MRQLRREMRREMRRLRRKMHRLRREMRRLRHECVDCVMECVDCVVECVVKCVDCVWTSCIFSVTSDLTHRPNIDLWPYYIFMIMQIRPHPSWIFITPHEYLAPPLCCVTSHPSMWRHAAKRWRWIFIHIPFVEKCSPKNYISHDVIPHYYSSCLINIHDYAN